MTRGTRGRWAGTLVVALIACSAICWSARSTEIRHSYTFPAPTWTASPDWSGYEIPALAGARTLGHPGEPLLPVFTARILLPPGEDVVSVRVVPQAASVPSAHLPAPADAEHPYCFAGPFPQAQPRREIYSSASAFPQSAARLATVQTYRGHRIAYINLFPLRAHPAAGQVAFTPALELQVTTAPREGLLVETSKTYRDSPSTRAWLARGSDNPEMADRYAGSVQRGATPARSLVDPAETKLYVILTSTSLEPVYEPLAEDRTRKGLPAAVVTRDAILSTYDGRDNQERIRNFLLDAFQNWETEYVLIAGDVNVIPDRDCYCFIYDEGEPLETNDLCCELYYGGLDGTWNDDHDNRWGEVGEADLIPDIHVARVCTDNSTEAQAFIDKLLRYEREPVADEIETAAFFGEFLWQDTWGGEYMEEVRLGSDNWDYETAGVSPPWKTVTHYEMDGGWTGWTFINRMNAGMHMAHHLGHTSFDFAIKVSVTQVSSFTADGITHTYGIGYTQGCHAGQFDSADCINEEWVNSPTGFVAFVGNTRLGFAVHGSTHGSSQYYHRQFVDAFMSEGINELAGANDDSRVDNVGYIEYEANRWVHYEITAFGDPAMPIWTTTPRTPELEHAGIFLLGMGAYPITVRFAGLPVEGARVCLWDDAGTGYDFGVTDAGGEVALDPAPTVPGTMHLVVSDANLLVTEETFEILPAGPYILVEGHALDDTGGGNGDGDCDAGETIELTVELHNVWSGTITGVNATLSGQSAYVEVTDAQAFYGDFAGDEVKAGSFQFRVTGDCPDQEPLVFDLAIEDDSDGEWTGAFTYVASAPVLSISSLHIDDSAGGDGDGSLGPGESAAVTVRLVNEGHSAATEVNATLLTHNPWLTITQPDAACAEVLPGGVANLLPVFEVTVDAEAFSPTIILCTLDLNGDWDLEAELPVTLGIGAFDDDMEDGEGAWTHAVAGGGFLDQWHRSNARNHTPGGGWSWKFGDDAGGDYANLADGVLTMPAMAIAQTVQLSFWHWIDAEASQTYPGECYDGALVEISVDAGAWNQITPESGYPYTIREGSIPGPFPAGTPVFSGTRDWQREVFVLEVAGDSVQVRFRFGSDGAETREGWYIDDAELLSWPPPSDADEAAGFVQLPLLGPNRPNPFAPETRVALRLPDARNLHLTVHDAEGRLVRTLVHGQLDAGLHWIVWDGRDSDGRAAAAGIYHCRLKAGSETWVRKMTLLR